MGTEESNKVNSKTVQKIIWPTCSSISLPLKITKGRPMIDMFSFWFRRTTRWSSLSRQTKVHLCQALVMSVLMYSVESLTAVHQGQLESFHMRCQRQLVNIHWSDYVTNKSVCEACQLSMITRVPDACPFLATLYGWMSRSPQTTGDWHEGRQKTWSELELSPRSTSTYLGGSSSWRCWNPFINVVVHSTKAARGHGAAGRSTLRPGDNDDDDCN